MILNAKKFLLNKTAIMRVNIISFIAYCLFSSVDVTHAMADSGKVRPNASGITVNLRKLRCNASGLNAAIRNQQKTIEILVVGDPMGLRCAISITQALLERSDPYAGYVCVTNSRSKPAYIVNDPNDRRVRNIRNFKKHFEEATLISNKTGWPIRIIWVDTASGAPKANKKCRS